MESVFEGMVCTCESFLILSSSTFQRSRQVFDQAAISHIQTGQIPDRGGKSECRKTPSQPGACLRITIEHPLDAQDIGDYDLQDRDFQEELFEGEGSMPKAADEALAANTAILLANGEQRNSDFVRLCCNETSTRQAIHHPGSRFLFKGGKL